MCRRIGITFISGVGFRVARSTVSGNAKASKCGTSDGENSHAFLYMYVNINFIFLSLGVCRIVTNIVDNMKKDDLIRQGKELLSCVKKRNIFDPDFADENCMDKTDIQKLLTWFERVEEFVEKFGLECQKNRLADNSWIVNGERVSVERIKKILSIIESVEEK